MGKTIPKKGEMVNSKQGGPFFYDDFRTFSTDGIIAGRTLQTILR